MKYLSLFSGIGGFELGIGSEEECIGFSEIDKYATQIYQSHFKRHRPYGDITKIDEKELPDFDLLVGGFPCQSFSVAGKRGGFSDTRGTMFFEIARIIKEKRPRYLLLENVKGLLSHDNGKTFRTIICALDELGYDNQWQVLNSKDFGVPQNRERVFIVGHLRGTPRPQVFPFSGSDEADTRAVGKGLTNTLTGRNAGNGNHRGNLVQLNQPKHSNDRVYADDGIAPTLNTMQGGMRQPKVVRQPLRFLTRNQKNIEGDYAFTVDASNTSGVRDGMQIRRLTPMECERLQGFPDGWTEGVSDTQRYKCLGNAVTVSVVREIMKKLL